jgi:ubiquinone/menaquinone biosynthesis C-methylase UbiE
MSEKLFDPANAGRLDDPDRRRWLPPEAVLDLLEIQEGMTVADVGAGTGYFALPLAERVGSTGLVFAVDVQPEMLERLEANLAGRPEAGRIRPSLGAAEDTGLPDACADRVFLANVWHEVEDHGAVLREAARILRGGGRLAILDWRTDVERPPGPPLEHRVSPARTYIALEDAGWTVVLTDDVGDYSYLMVAVPPGS